MIIWDLDSNFTAAMAPHLMSSIVGIKVPFIITAAELLKYAINNNGPEVKLNLLMADLFLKI
jgi:hypothetical protein